MADPPDKLTPTDPRDLADTLAFALRYQGRKRVHNADEIMGEIVAKRLVEHLARTGFVVMQRAPIGAARRSGEDLRSRRAMLAGRLRRQTALLGLAAICSLSPASALSAQSFLSARSRPLA